MNHLITLHQIRDERPCADGWTKLLVALGENHAAPDLTRQVSIGDIAQSNGAADAIWCLRCINDPRMPVRAVMPAVRRASVHTTDQMVHDCIAAIEKWLDGDDSVDLQAVARAARAAESAAARAARAARGAARAAAKAAARGAAEAAWAAWAAAWAAARAARAAANAAARAAAEGAAEREHQRRDLIDMFGLHALKS